MHNSSIEDFVLIEYRDTLGGRVAHTDFGKDANGKPYTVELGANWVGRSIRASRSKAEKNRCKDLALPEALV